jgi:hypothetical protein
LLEIMVELAKRMQHSVKHWHLWRYAVVKIWFTLFFKKL